MTGAPPALNPATLALAPPPAWTLAELVAAAWCWRLDRRDGLVLTLTSHDRDLVLTAGACAGLYRAAPGLRPSAIALEEGLDGAMIDVDGAISSDAITAADLDAGRWDGAAALLLLARWDEPGADSVVVARGTLGAIERRGHAFTAQLNGSPGALDAPVVPAAAPTCRAAFGDGDCRVNLARFRHGARAVAVAGARVTIAADASLAGLAPQDFVHGWLRWRDGVWTGLASPIAAASLDAGGAMRVDLAHLPLGPAPDMPVAVDLTQGCDKRAATCADRFANVANFRGEAHLPGNDLLTRYPGG